MSVIHVNAVHVNTIHYIKEEKNGETIVYFRICYRRTS